MTPERWKQIDELAQAAIDRGGDERAAFLDEACAGDDALRREVESQIAYQQQASKFLEEPAFNHAAELIADPQTETESMEGRTISHYSILRKLGAGGMGEVYLAQDTTLGRKVAIKFLSQNSVAGEQARKRFVREARAAAALDHPHICAVYEVGEEAGYSFIVMQYVEGETLAGWVKGKTLELAEALDIAAQIVDALAAAHSRGIIHRDIKPQNIMINAAGQVKVLDFGLAKVVRETSLLESSADTESLLTDAGTVMGTVPYMSPEQVRGESLDTRSDLFSFGALLYEMVSGRQPFAAETTAATFSAILTRDPALLARYSADAPAELQRIVSKTLAKDREERYQTSKDLLIDLRRLKQRMEFEAELARSASPEDQHQKVVTVSLSPESETASKSPVPTAESGVARPTASAAYTVSPVRRHKGLAMALAIVVIAVAGVIYLAWRSKVAGSGRQAIESIAVLPFVNASPDAENEYLSDGITESLINSLSQLPHLRVMSRNSVFRFKGPEMDAKAAGNALGVSAVLTGRVTQRGQDLIISTELIDVRDNSNLWGEQYSRRLSDLFAVQAEITKEISGTLRLKLSGAEQSRVTKRYTENSEAYQLNLKGRFFWLKFTPADHQRAADYFNQAIAKDPNYALAYAGLADTYGASAGAGWIAPSDAYPKAKVASNKALELDETLAEAHATLGALTMLLDFNWAAAEREFKRAIDLNPNYYLTYDIYSGLLCATGRLDEAIAMGKRGLEADPLSLSYSMNYAYYYARRYDEGIKQWQKSLEMDPNTPSALTGLGAIYEQKGMYDEAIASYQKLINLTGRTSGILGVLGHACAASGRRGEALKILEELKEMSKQKYVSPFDLAVLYTGLGEKDRAIEQLQKAYQERASAMLIDLKVEPLFDPLRSDPRFADLLQRMGL